MPYLYTYTIFTPTYNRAYCLTDVYESLRLQTFKDFEWLIVDDGSTDNTKKLVYQWIKENKFPIKYYYQSNKGKHRARNFAVKQAQGKFFFTWDSDDICVPRALEEMKFQWDSIPEREKSSYAGVAGLCSTSDGNIIGSKFPYDSMDSDMFLIRTRYNVDGDKCGFQRTDVMLEFPFPEFEGEKFIPESIVWNRIARKYKTRFFNVVLRICRPRQDGLSAAGIRLIIENPHGKALFFNEYMAMPTTPFIKLKAGINYVRCSLHTGQGLSSLIKKASIFNLAILGLPLGIILYYKDRATYEKQYRLANK